MEPMPSVSRSPLPNAPNEIVIGANIADVTKAAPRK